MEGQVVISIENLVKVYSIYPSKNDRMKEALSFTRKKYHTDFYALNNVSLQVKHGESVGIIGLNGSGKSTLLKILAGILNPTSGKVEVNGKVAALLELGAGFNPEMTGRENIYLNGAIMGFSKAEVDAKIKDILEFAEIGGFAEQPVKMYSSGMFARLAFAVAINVNPDVLLVDEALAVGDIFFRQKCYARLEELKRKGTAIVLVSHSMNEIEQFCDKAILLSKGKVKYWGDSKVAVRQYYLLQEKTHTKSLAGVEDNGLELDGGEEAIRTFEEEAFSRNRNIGFKIKPENEISNGQARCIYAAICDAKGNEVSAVKQGETVNFCYGFEVLQDLKNVEVGVLISDAKNNLIHGKNSLQVGCNHIKECYAGDLINVVHKIKMDIIINEYTFEVGLIAVDEEIYANPKSVPHSQFDPHVKRICHVTNLGPFNVTFTDDYQGRLMQLQHYGMADLPTEITISKIPFRKEGLAQ
jgi:ABC-type polysaccharide/polyol phosphate transport system ATPase subunit